MATIHADSTIRWTVPPERRQSLHRWIHHALIAQAHHESHLLLHTRGPGPRQGEKHKGCHGRMHPTEERIKLDKRSTQVTHLLYRLYALLRGLDPSKQSSIAPSIHSLIVMSNARQ
ncbi:hypothetical protein BO94DRAFT_587056 [Aspergillus sclerotioniger CBS 115572]|uniref:Uncharacterized protein n=1 Tax=Aspergillus sclerotioniger CBS 115572 TaxID=1450535 RepID=A0A317WDM1_9EURO|nr:hypothetical protein BO94DRAFT_587056 [Aspergillus sclerotioniger CBS 115572]PWY83158.1 hypothetical protein BO94DRAFT_587056 [Aspergillus sclerotioniger CBS 115572]